MGFSGGNCIARDMMNAMMDCGEFTHDLRKYVYKALIPSIEDQDCDTLDELLGCDDAFDEVWDELAFPPPEGFTGKQYNALRKEVGKYLRSDDNLTGIQFFYDMGNPEPYRMMDDQATYTFEVFEQLINAAAEYRQEMDDARFGDADVLDRLKQSGYLQDEYQPKRMSEHKNRSCQRSVSAGGMAELNNDGDDDE